VGSDFGVGDDAAEVVEPLSGGVFGEGGFFYGGGSGVRGLVVEIGVGKGLGRVA
jgi:hypothetical protein